MTSELEAFRAVNFDWTRQLKSIWIDPPYHVPAVHEATIEDIADYFVSRTGADYFEEPLGRVVVGPAGFGKTHLIGELRRRVWSTEGWFVLLDLIGVKDFWASVALGFLNSLQVRMPNKQTQYDRLIVKLTEHLNLRDDLVRLTADYRGRPGELVLKLVALFVDALSREYRTETLRHRDIVTALVLFISEEFEYHSVAHAWLQGMNLDPEISAPLGFREENSPLKVVEGLSWLMSLVGPTLIAVDQIDAIVSASNAYAIAAVQTPEEESEARSIVEMLAQGLMDLHEKKRRAITVISCLEATWKVLEGTTAAVTARYHQPTALYPLNSGEMVQDLIATRVAMAYRIRGFTPHYPTWPFTSSAIASAIDFTPRQLLKRCEDFRRKCVVEGAVSECFSFDDFDTEVPHDVQEPDHISDAYNGELATADIVGLLGAEGEGALQSLLHSTLQLLVEHFNLPDAVDVAVQRDPDQKRPSLHGRLSFIFHNEGDREQHYCFRILEHTNAVAFQSRLKAAMTASGIKTALRFRHLFVLRRGNTPGGTITETLVAQFQAAGGQFLAPTENDLRIFVALRAVARRELPGFEAWLRTRKPLFETEFFKRAGLTPPPFLPVAEGPDGTLRPAADAGTPPRRGGTAAHTESGEGRARETRGGAAKPQETSQRIPVGQRFERRELGETVYLGVELLPRHVAIFAGSGSGKTVLLRRLVEEAALLGIPAVVLDINNDLSRLGDCWPEVPDKMHEDDISRARRYHGCSEVVIWTPGANSGRPISLPLLPDFSKIGQGIEAQDERNQAVEMALATISPYVSGGGQRGALRQGVLADALRYFTKEGTDSLDDFINLMADLPDDVSQIDNCSRLAAEIANQLRAAIATNPLLRSDGEKLDPAKLFHGANAKTRVSVINFCGLASQEARQAFVNQLQMALFTWIKQNPSETGRLYVLDEAQNFAPSQTKTACKASAQSLAAQARKYGLGMILATQLPKGIDNGIVSNCTTHIYGRMSSPTTIGAIKELMAAKGGAQEDIGKLNSGEFYFSTSGISRPIKIKTPLCLSWHAPTPPTAEEVMRKARE